MTHQDVGVKNEPSPFPEKGIFYRPDIFMTCTNPFMGLTQVLSHLF